MTLLYRVRTIFTGSPINGDGVNDLYFDANGGTAAQAVAAVGAFWGGLDNNFVSTLSWATESDVVTIDDANGQAFALTSTTVQSGTGSDPGPALPPTIQGLIRWRTGTFINGRELRGRCFVPGPDEAMNGTNGLPEAAYTGALQAGADALVASANAQLRVYSPTHFDSADVVTASAWSKWASLRSRRD